MQSSSCKESRDDSMQVRPNSYSLALTMHFWPCLVPHVKLGNWYSIHINFGSIGIHLNDDCEEKIWDHFDSFLLSFSFLDPKVRK